MGSKGIQFIEGSSNLRLPPSLTHFPLGWIIVKEGRDMTSAKSGPKGLGGPFPTTGLCTIKEEPNYGFWKRQGKNG